MSKFNTYIDHTILKADAVKEDILKLCEEAKKYNFMSVCINSYWVKTAAEALKGSKVKVCTVIGFPLGASSGESKAFEAEQAIIDGATEVDMVINIGALKDGDDESVKKDIQGVVKAAKEKALVKLIIEACLLTEEEKVRACRLGAEAGVDFVKTSTGFSTGGAVIEDVQLMRKTVGDHIGVKASGGIRSLEDAVKFIEAGANRLGTSGGVKIMEQSGDLQ